MIYKLFSSRGLKTNVRKNNKDFGYCHLCGDILSTETHKDTQTHTHGIIHFCDGGGMKREQTLNS